MDKVANIMAMYCSVIPQQLTVFYLVFTIKQLGEEFNAYYSVATCIHVKFSFHFQVSGDSDRSNNLRISTTPVQVQLTPPPNLRVESVVSPASFFSG